MGDQTQDQDVRPTQTSAAGASADHQGSLSSLQMLGISNSTSPSATDGTASTAPLSAASQQHERRVSLQPLQPSHSDPAWVTEAVACNTVGDVCEDVGTAELREVEPLQSFNGLWPEFALVNHSCMPNTVSGF